MWHKQEVYVAIRHPFTLAVRECGIGREDLIFSHFKGEIADEVVSRARVPSMGSHRAVKEMMMRPWKMPTFTRDDGVADMGVCEMKRICLDWLHSNRARVDAVIAWTGK